MEVDAFFCQAQWLLRRCSQPLCDRTRKQRYGKTFQLICELTALSVSHQAPAGLVKPGHSRAVRLRTGSSSCIRTEFSTAASSAVGSTALRGAHAQPFARAFATGPTSGQAKSRPGLSPKASPPNLPWMLPRGSKAPPGTDPAKQTPSNVVNKQDAAAPESGLRARPEQSQARSANAAPGSAESQAKYADDSSSHTSQRSAAASEQGADPDAERRERFHSVDASTSAPSNGSSHLPGSSNAASAQSSASEPSQYAQKEVQFDVAASRKQGGNAIRDLLETQKITLQEYAPGQKPKTRCPRCHGGSQHEDSLAVNISVDSQSAAWKCHRATCGWEGGIDQKAGV